MEPRRPAARSAGHLAGEAGGVAATVELRAAGPQGQHRQEDQDPDRQQRQRHRQPHQPQHHLLRGERGRVRAVVQCIPYNSGAAVTGPSTVSDTTLTVANNAASVTAPYTDAQDGCTITLLPPSNTTISTVAVSENSGQCLDDTDLRQADGTQYQQYYRGGGYQQMYDFKPVAGYINTYTVVNRHSGKCLDDSSASTADGAAVIQWTCSGTTNHPQPRHRAWQQPGLPARRRPQRQVRRCLRRLHPAASTEQPVDLRLWRHPQSQEEPDLAPPGHALACVPSMRASGIGRSPWAPFPCFRTAAVRVVDRQVGVVGGRQRLEDHGVAEDVPDVGADTGAVLQAGASEGPRDGPAAPIQHDLRPVVRQRPGLDAASAFFAAEFDRPSNRSYRSSASSKGARGGADLPCAVQLRRKARLV